MRIGASDKRGAAGIAHLEQYFFGWNHLRRRDFALGQENGAAAVPVLRARL